MKEEQILKRLNSYMYQIAKVEEGLAEGKINFSYDRLMCAMKPGHPAELLDDVISSVAWTIADGKIPTLEEVTCMSQNLEGFANCFSIGKLLKIAGELQHYIELHSADWPAGEKQE